MDEFTIRHLAAWIESVIQEDEQHLVSAGIKKFVLEYPEVIERGDSWSEIRRMAERLGYME